MTYDITLFFISSGNFSDKKGVTKIYFKVGDFLSGRQRSLGVVSEGRP